MEREIDIESHRPHHEFIARWIERERRRDEMWEKIKVQVGGWAVIAFLGGIGLAAWQFVKAHLK